MSLIQFDPIDSDSRGQEVITPSPPNEGTDLTTDYSDEPNRGSWVSFFRKVVHLLQPFISNFKALVSRFIQLCRKPEDLAWIILDFCALAPSIIWIEWQTGPDLLYPLSHLKKHKSRRLARQLLDHSRGARLCNIQNASSSRAGVDPPRVAVINLDNVPPERIAKGYTVSADFYGFIVMVIFLEVLVAPVLYVFSPLDLGPCREKLSQWYTLLFGNWFSSWFAFITGILWSTPGQQLLTAMLVIFPISLYAVIRGESTLVLVLRSDISTPSCAVLLDHDFTVILTGPQNVVEAVAESNFRASHALKRSYQQEVWELGEWLCFEAFKALCQGAPFAMLAGFWLILGPASYFTVFVPLIPAMVMSLVSVRTCMNHQDSASTSPQDFKNALKYSLRAPVIIICVNAPTYLLIVLYELAIANDPVLLAFVHPTTYVQLIPFILVIGHFVVSQNYRIRTAKLLEVLGNPEVQRWEFNTLAAAATFQCLVLCHGISRPVDRINMLTLLDMFVPDERDVWTAWKARVADRITHEIDIDFTPTIPLFRGRDQKHFIQLLDEAKAGYDEYKSFYVSLLPTIYPTIVS